MLVMMKDEDNQWKYRLHYSIVQVNEEQDNDLKNHNHKEMIYQK